LDRLELTETAAIKQSGTRTALIQRLGALGCKFALDDFGTGVNSLAYLKALKTRDDQNRRLVYSRSLGK